MFAQHDEAWPMAAGRQIDTPPLKTTLRLVVPPPPPNPLDDDGPAEIQAHLRHIARRSTQVARETIEIIERSRSQMAEGTRRLAKAEQVLVIAERRLEQARTA